MASAARIIHHGISAFIWVVALFFCICKINYLEAQRCLQSYNLSACLVGCQPNPVRHAMQAPDVQLLEGDGAGPESPSKVGAARKVWELREQMNQQASHHCRVGTNAQPPLVLQCFL